MEMKEAFSLGLDGRKKEKRNSFYVSFLFLLLILVFKIDQNVPFVDEIVHFRVFWSKNPIEDNKYTGFLYKFVR